jgi:uncharacterized protein YndB with AHSA1/START domain
LTQRTRFDWSEFRLGVYIRTTPEALYDLWTTSSGLTCWFLRSAAFAQSAGPPRADDRDAAPPPPFESLPPRDDGERCRKNDRYRWEWHYNGGIIGEHWILATRAPTKIVFGFGDRMAVEVLIRKHGELCEVDLRQYNIPTTPRGRTDLHMGCRVAWTFFLTNLKSVAEGGHDLREVVRSRTQELHLVNI